MVDSRLHHAWVGCNPGAKRVGRERGKIRSKRGFPSRHANKCIQLGNLCLCESYATAEIGLLNLKKYELKKYELFPHLSRAKFSEMEYRS